MPWPNNNLQERHQRRALEHRHKRIADPNNLHDANFSILEGRQRRTLACPNLGERFNAAAILADIPPDDLLRCKSTRQQQSDMGMETCGVVLEGRLRSSSTGTRGASDIATLLRSNNYRRGRLNPSVRAILATYALPVLPLDHRGLYAWLWRDIDGTGMLMNLGSNK
jgi:hypothetical protein